MSRSQSRNGGRPSPPRRYAVTNARVLAIAVPITLSNGTTPLIGVVATAIVGRLGQAHILGAVALSSVVFDCLFWLFDSSAWARWRSPRRRWARPM